jgi:phosphatidylserine/phosphatidylglycerophosphate/cardiolipin synthase-like enzyme
VWRDVTAAASGVIVDAADYYYAFYWAARRARRSILISGWEFDSGVPLLRGADAPPGEEVRFLRFLNGLCAATPGLFICLLAWDFNLVLAGEREWLQRIFFHWLTHERFHFHVDDSPIVGGSHHQKFVVIDGHLAFLGGMDICEARWDDRRHLAENPVRLARGWPQKPYHDVQVYLAGGDAPAALEQYFLRRWQRAGGKLPPLPAAATDDTARRYEPRGALVLGPTSLGLSRTQPHTTGLTIREVERVFTDAIAWAERMIYIETQYFSSWRIRDALEARMRDAHRPHLEIVIVVNERAEALKEEIAVGLRQVKNIADLRGIAAETGHPLGVYYTMPEGADDGDDARSTYVHSKLMVVDDRFLTIGSANLTNRSMGVDSELHASWEAGETDDRLRDAIRRVRVSLLAEHSGMMQGHPEDVFASMEGIVARLDAIADKPGARLRCHRPPSPEENAILSVVDPESLPFDPDGVEPLTRSRARRRGSPSRSEIGPGPRGRARLRRSPSARSRRGR